MTAADAIEEIWLTYQVMKDALKVTTRSINHNAVFLLQGTNFIDSITDVAKTHLEICRNAASDYAIFSMWAVFERTIISTIVGENAKMLETPPAEFNKEVHVKIADTIEHWRSKDLLDLIKPLVGSELVSHAKQIKKHRDWLAHKNPNRPSPANVTPDFTYKVLSDISLRLSE